MTQLIIVIYHVLAAFLYYPKKLLFLFWEFLSSLEFIKKLFLLFSDSFNRLQPNVPVTPIQGPIFLQNDSVPVLPLYAYPKVYNGTLMQIPVS